MSGRQQKVIDVRLPRLQHTASTRSYLAPSLTTIYKSHEPDITAGTYVKMLSASFFDRRVCSTRSSNRSPGVELSIGTLASFGWWRFCGYHFAPPSQTMTDVSQSLPACAFRTVHLNMGRADSNANEHRTAARDIAGSGFGRYVNDDPHA
ncbi:carbon monoxide dehydrogenase [Anopheles sinensis]|uniref:Carbon monoxide dehydrogenase n=1 Tax=Anopheles sinensis TaxID=74873 RepID=A0A084WGE8_ANOSI|nr:carbon monoxide dehydrogenase [Anopheles sinensis]